MTAWRVREEGSPSFSSRTYLDAVWVCARADLATQSIVAKDALLPLALRVPLPVPLAGIGMGRRGPVFPWGSRLARGNMPHVHLEFPPGCEDRVLAVRLTPAGTKRATEALPGEAVFQHVINDSGVDPKRVNRAASQFRSARRPAVVMGRGIAVTSGQRAGRAAATGRGPGRAGSRCEVFNYVGRNFV
jgi:hypothetical protein